MPTIAPRTNQSLIFGLFLGLLIGGALTRLSTLNTEIELSTGRNAILLCYALTILLPALYVRWQRVPSFTMRFLSPLLAFMMSTIIWHVTLRATSPDALPFFGHAWRLGAMLAIGAILSAAVAQLTGTRAVAGQA